MKRLASVGLGLILLGAPDLAQSQTRQTPPPPSAIPAPPPMALRPSPPQDRGLDWTPSGKATARPSVITNPSWQMMPTPAQIIQAFPEDAARRGLSGRATLECTVTAYGHLTACSIVDETPQGAGFGQAALKLSPIFEMRPRTVDGAPVEGAKVRVPVNFAISDVANPFRPTPPRPQSDGTLTSL